MTRTEDDLAPIEISYQPRHHRRSLPAEVVARADLLERISDREISARQRVGFHQLVVCTSGRGSHVIDFQEVHVSAGTVLRIHPGQVQQFITEPRFEAVQVVWPPESHHSDPGTPMWFPGSEAPTRWDVDAELLARILGWIEELEDEQRRFDGSPRRVQLIHALLCALLLRLAIELPDAPPSVSMLPEAYLEFRELIEKRLYDRPTILELAHDLGYSSRTLDRVCEQVTGRTAKHLLDERVALEVRRLLTYTTRPLTQVASSLGFRDPSNFSKFVRRHLGETPREIRESVTGITR